MVTQDLDAQYHYSIRAKKTIPMWQNFSDKLTQMMDTLNPILKPMQLIHITTEEQYNVLMRTFELKGFKPFEICAGFQGERFYEYSPNYLALHPNAWDVTHGRNEIIEFEDFINDHK